MYFRSSTKTQSTLHVQKLGIITRYGARQHETITPTRSGEIVKVRFISSNIIKITIQSRSELS